MEKSGTGASNVIAWTKGRLYGMVSVTGPGADNLATRLADAQERRFELALSTGGLSADPRLPYFNQGSSLADPSLDAAPLTLPALRIDHAGLYSLAQFGVGALTFTPSTGHGGVSLPVVLDLPMTPQHRWFWRVTTHALVTLAPNASSGTISLEPKIANIAGPGADFVVAQNLTTGARRLVEITSHIASAHSLEVTGSAMLGGSPSPRQDTHLDFLIRPGTSQRSLARVTVMPDSSIEVLDDPAEIGKAAIKTPRVAMRP